MNTIYAYSMLFTFNLKIVSLSHSNAYYEHLFSKINRVKTTRLARNFQGGVYYS